LDGLRRTIAGIVGARRDRDEEHEDRGKCGDLHSRVHRSAHKSTARAMIALHRIRPELCGFGARMWITPSMRDGPCRPLEDVQPPQVGCGVSGRPSHFLGMKPSERGSWAVSTAPPAAPRTVLCERATKR